MRDINRFPALRAAIPGMLGDGLENLAQETAEQIDKGFSSGQDALGREWQPLSPVTIRMKGHDAILIDSGEMRDSITYGVDRTRLIARVGSNDDKLQIHEFGLARVPKRPVLVPAALWASRNLDRFSAPVKVKLAEVAL